MLQDDPAGSIRRACFSFQGEITSEANLLLLSCAVSPVTCGTSKSCTGASRPSYFRSIRDMADDIEEGVDSRELLILFYYVLNPYNFR